MHDASISTKLFCDCLAVYILWPTNHLRRSSIKLYKCQWSAIHSFREWNQTKQDVLMGEPRILILINTSSWCTWHEKSTTSHSIYLETGSTWNKSVWSPNIYRYQVNKLLLEFLYTTIYNRRGKKVILAVHHQSKAPFGHPSFLLMNNIIFVNSLYVLKNHLIWIKLSK